MSKENWWQRPDLGYRNGRLYFAEEDLESLGRSMGTPAFVYSLPRTLDKLEDLHDALDAAQVPHTVFYALKANRHPGLLNTLRSSSLCGVDACSPNELRLARQSGFQEREITYTGTSVGNADLDLLARMPGVQLNCDSLSSLKRLGDRAFKITAHSL